MTLNETALDEFKEYLVQSMNADVYYQLKDWLNSQVDEDQDYQEVIDYFVDNLHGSLQWVN